MDYDFIQKLSGFRTGMAPGSLAYFMLLITIHNARLDYSGGGLLSFSCPHSGDNTRSIISAMISATSSVIGGLSGFGSCGSSVIIVLPAAWD
jgi:hypothetical protein